MCFAIIFCIFSKLADRNDRTSSALLKIALPRTISRDAQMAECEIVTQRIIGMQAPQTPCDVQCHPPAGTLQRRQADITRDAGDMRIQRNDQLARGDSRPDPTIYSIVWPYHPPQIQVHALAGTALRRRRKEES